MAQAIDPGVGSCPLCGDEVRLDVPDWRVNAKWRDVLVHRDKWADVAAEFRARRSVGEAALALSISPALAERLLNFLCTQLCGCRAATCISCLDDYRSGL